MQECLSQSLLPCQFVALALSHLSALLQNVRPQPGSPPTSLRQSLDS